MILGQKYWKKANKIIQVELCFFKKSRFVSTKTMARYFQKLSCEIWDLEKKKY